MADKILILQQVAHEGAGRLFGAIRRAGAVEEVIPCYQPDVTLPKDLNDYRGLILMGGPMSVNDDSPVLAAQRTLVQQAIAADFPTLGICLGGQLIAAAAGARVSPRDTPEIGWYDVTLSMESATDPLFADLPNPLPVFQWHGEGFDLPAGAVHLASSEACPHQAFRLGQRVYGLQFHLEMEAPMVKEWLTVNTDELQQLGDQVQPEAILGDTDLQVERIGPISDLLADRWLTLAAGA